MIITGGKKYMCFKINFKLRDINEIVPFGKQNNYMSWFTLTDADLWIDVGNSAIYEYSQKARELWNCEDIKYNDYQLSRFLEDFSGLFSTIREPVPKFLYDISQDFIHLTDTWQKSDYNEPDDTFEIFYEDEYIPLTTWFFDRMLNSAHLIGGPDIGFFRYDTKIKIYWTSDYFFEDGTSIWTSPEGSFELDYKDFVAEVIRFFDSFFLAMDKQVSLALSKDWGNIHLDKKRLVEEHQQRRKTFYQCINLLTQDITEVTDWEKISRLYSKMINDTAFLVFRMN